MDFLKTLKRDSAIKLPPLPHVALKVMEVLREEEFSIDKLSEAIETDPALATRVLSMANSAFYSSLCKADTVKRAVSILGGEMIKNMALLIIISKNFKSNRLSGFDYDLFWMRAITAATAAETLAAKLGKQQEDIFAAGLLMDIGTLVMCYVEPEKFAQIGRQKQISKKSPITSIERSLFGADHMEIGSEVLRIWNLPESIYIPVAYHHGIKECPEDQRDTAMILMISAFISTMELSEVTLPKLVRIKKFLDQARDFSFDEAEELLDEIAEKRIHIFEMMNFTPTPGSEEKTEEGYQKPVPEGEEPARYASLEGPSRHKKPPPKKKGFFERLWAGVAGIFR